MQEFDMPYVRDMLAEVLSLAIESLSFVVKHYSGFSKQLAPRASTV
jgi:hypothetical protein